MLRLLLLMGFISPKSKRQCKRTPLLPEGAKFAITERVYHPVTDSYWVVVDNSKWKEDLYAIAPERAEFFKATHKAYGETLQRVIKLIN